MMCTKLEGSTMAETKEPHNHKRGEGPVKAYDLPRQIEDNGLDSSSRKKRQSEQNESKRSKLNRTISYDNEKIELSGRLKSIKEAYFPNKKTCPSGLCGGYTNKE